MTALQALHRGTAPIPSGSSGYELYHSIWDTMKNNSSIEYIFKNAPTYAVCRMSGNKYTYDSTTPKAERKHYNKLESPSDSLPGSVSLKGKLYLDL